MTDSLARSPDSRAARRALHSALASGQLIDVTGDAIHWLPMPVFLTRAVWRRYIIPPRAVRSFLQTDARRLSDTLEALGHAVWRAVRRTSKLDMVEFTVTLRMRRFPRWTTLRLKAVATPGADGTCAYITVMMPNED